MAEEDREHLADLRRRHQRRLRELERQAATFGASTPPEVRIEIEDIQAELARIDASISRSPIAERLDQIAPRTVARHNLPAQATSLVGRELEVAQICALLRRPDTRLVTLTGPGGAGKTRLGLQAAAELFDDFADGVFFVGLAPLSDPSLLLATIAQAIGLRAAERQPQVDELKAFLRERQTMLLLDNFEHVTQAAPAIGELLAAAPDLSILATSRVVLQIYGEREFAVPPLSLPDVRHLPDPDQLSQYEAVRLFIERAVAVRPNFTVTNQNAPAVAAICARLDGLPLAIELAAARIKFLAPQALLEKLEHRLKVVIGGARDLPARQQTLRGAIDWSYELLDADERVLFTRLAVFVGGITIAAAEAVCNAAGELPIDLASGIESLVNKSLLKQADEFAGEPRFAMLETIREYALEKLEQSGEASVLRDRHLAFFQAYIDTIKRESPADTDWRDRIDPEYDNFRAALSWSQAAPRASVTALQLGNALAPYWMKRGDYQEGQRWLDQALAQHLDAPERLRANVLHQAGRMADLQGDYPGARNYYEQSLALFRSIGNGRAVANILTELGWIDYFVGDHAKARLQAEESLALHREADSKPGIASALLLIGRLAATAGDYSLGKAYYEESLAIRRQVGEPGGISGALDQLGDLARGQGDYTTARALYEESLVIKRRSSSKRAIAGSLVRLAVVVVWQGEFERSKQLFDDGLALFREIGARRGVAWTVSSMGWSAHAQADYQAARGYLEQSRALFQALGERSATANQIRSLGDVCADQGDYAAAERHYQESLAIWRALDNPLGIGMTMRRQGSLAFRQRAYEQAIALLEASLAVFRQTTSQRDISRVLAELARTVTRCGDHSRAHLLYEESLALAQAIDHPWAIVEGLEGQADLAQARGDPAGAARLLAAAERRRAENSAHRWPADRPEYDALVDAVRAALGDEPFEQAWAAGQMLTIEQAVADVLNR